MECTATAPAPILPTVIPTTPERINALCEAHAEWAKQIARSFAGETHADVDDCESAALQALWEAAKQDDDPDREFKPFAAKAIKNQLRMLLRCNKRAAKNKPTVSIAAIPGFDRPAPLDPRVTASHANDARLVKLEAELDGLDISHNGILRILTPQQKEIIRRHYEQAESFAKIAGAMAVPLQAIKNAHASAIALLRDALGLKRNGRPRD